jgi:hypothetical protein
MIVFNRLTTRFGDASQFHDLVSNPKYSSIIDDLQVNISGLKEDLGKILSEKRASFPLFLYFSDAQLLHLIAHSHEPSQFTEISSEIERALFDNMQCIGFRCSSALSQSLHTRSS